MCPPKKIRRIAKKYIDHACVGQTIEVDGSRFHTGPVAITMGKTVIQRLGGLRVCWARTVLATLSAARGAWRDDRHHDTADPADVALGTRA